ncbi:hypothetical protein [Halocatena pleomorpha]|uniref:Uncharacterized protein n=1 Tax=Halocatena pleomorpha TaxID=1785090 RepID=A0A3P3R9R8_9EURY|nr:hypothetical protein [Halocatena pleomorpha]RRJ30065.1 hypothetical protein EIK79_10800 [Halocatena pleomorpha]
MDSSNLRNQLDQVKEGASEQDEADEDLGNETETTTDESATDSKTETADPSETTGPAFAAQTSKKLSIYPNEETARLIKVLCNSVENNLIALGHDDFEVREAHDAMVRFAHEHPQKVTELVLEARDLDPDAVDDLP